MFDAFQTAIFGKVADKLKERFPHKSLRLAYADALIIEDLDFLKKHNKLIWEPSLKARVLIDMVEEHPVKLVIYYRGSPVGYAFGCYCSDTQSLKVCWMEKRNDAHEDLDHQMLGIVLDAYAAYGQFLQRRGTTVSLIAFMSPIEGSKRYYSDSGFEYIDDFHSGSPAMVLRNSIQLKDA